MVSVVTPVFNGARFLDEAARSVLTQTWTNLEWVVVDDGSTDATPAILAALDDSRVRVIRQANSGVGAARNAGIDAARGEFIAFMDADDVLPPNSIEERAGVLAGDPAIDIVEGAVSFRDVALQKEVRRWQPQVRGDMLPRLVRLDERAMCGPFFMVRRSRLGGVRFRTGMTHCEDLLFLIEFSSRSVVHYASVPQVTYLYRTGSGGAMSNMAGIERGYLSLLAELRALPRIGRWDYFRAKMRVARILTLSWVARGAWARGLIAGWRAIEA